MEMPFTYYTQSQISPLGGIGRHVCLRSISSGESSSLSEGTKNNLKIIGKTFGSFNYFSYLCNIK